MPLYSKLLCLRFFSVMPGVVPAAEVGLLVASRRARLYILGKGPKTINAPSGHITMGQRQTFETRANSRSLP